MSDGLPIVLSLRYLNEVDLCAFSATSRESYDQQNDDVVWRQLCEIRFQGKCIRLLEGTSLFAFGVYNADDLTEMELRKSLRMTKFRQSFNHLRRMECCKYKISLAHATLDSYRNKITQHEIGYFRWKLFYQNRPSSTGIRHFREDGV